MVEHRKKLQHIKMQFPKGSILTKEMLEELYNYPRNAMELQYMQYGDGILCGMDFREREYGKHEITPGILKWKGELYFLTKPLCIEEIFEEAIKPEQRYYLFFLPEEYKQEGMTFSNRTVFYLELKAIQSSEKNMALKNGFCYAYIQVEEESGVFLLDEDYPAGLGAGHNNDFYFPKRMMQKICSILEHKEKKALPDYTLLQQIYEKGTISADWIIMYIQEYWKANEIEKDINIEDKKLLFQEFLKAVENYHFCISATLAEIEEKRKTKEESRERLYGMI